MKKLFFVFIFISIGAFWSTKLFYKNNFRDKAAQMIMVGFNGSTLTKDNPIYRDIHKHHIGGVSHQRR